MSLEIRCCECGKILGEVEMDIPEERVSMCGDCFKKEEESHKEVMMWDLIEMKYF